MTVPALESARPFPEILEEFRRDPLSLVRKVPGIFPVDKPAGVSSHGAVAKARRILGIKRIGHAGTLDPLATGLLLLLVGNASRLFNHLQDFPKRYVAGFRLGSRTDSQDITGTELADWRPAREDAPAPREASAALADFVGEIMQVPPMHSALKRGGVPLYRLARKGVTVERAARPVRLYEAALTDFSGNEGVIALTVSSGFYVRTLIDDWGVVLGTGAVMTSLRRTAIGPFTLDDAVSLEVPPARGEMEPRAADRPLT